MLIEKDKRSEKLRLLYSNEVFSVPKNLYVIGMMNTADRSLAFMDYALRRRFKFFDMEPAFGSEGFRAYAASHGNQRMQRLIAAVESLNETIGNDESLGRGFQIGHSFFCTGEVVTDDWLRGVVEYELIPLLREYWFDEPSKVRAWSDALRSAIQ